MAARKLAIFVEGQTESIFIERLLSEIVGKHRLVIAVMDAVNLRTYNVNALDSGKTEFAVLIVDCRGDDTVKSRILENRSSLLKANYELILGIRDLYPIARADINKVIMHLRTGVPTKDLKIEICLSVMEIESWFLFDEHHYEKIDAALTCDVVAANFAFDPRVDDPEEIDEPAALLKRIYQHVGLTYNKSKTKVARTVDVLDYENLYFNGPGTLVQSAVFILFLDDFFA